jgi:hypothetical protein
MSRNIWSDLAEITRTGPSPTLTAGVPGANTAWLWVTIASASLTEASLGEPPVSPVP